MENIEKSLDHFFKGLKHTPGPWSPEGTQGKGKKKRAVFTVIKGSISFMPHNKHDERYPDERVEANSKLIAYAPDMLRSICRTYLWMLVKFAHDINGTCTSIRISANDTLASLRNQISNATGLECEHIQDTFEQYATWINMHEDIPDDTHHTQSA